MVMAQTPASTEYDGMPRNAIGTGLVDYELLPAEMPAAIVAYVGRTQGRPSRPALPPAPTESVMKKIFVLLRAQTGHDFSQYKPSTLERRVARRMAVHQIEAIDGYLKFLQRTPAEVEALFRDLLIGVTNFFRDPEAFKALEENVIPKLFAGKPAGATIRVWSSGCSTGEEAYSLAMLLAESEKSMSPHGKVQVFATDIDSQAIAIARAGVYPASIAADLSPERLSRFFSAEPSGDTFRVHKGLRDMLVFSEQDVIKDPPFSKLDLISCRNLLIYMGTDLQKKLMPLSHYALNPGGFLFLGTSETIGEHDDLFTVVDRKLKIYQRREDFHGARRAVLGRFPLAVTGADVALPPAAGKKRHPAKLPLRALTEHALLQQLVQVGALVDGRGDIFYLHGRTGLYLEPTPGEAGISNILKMAREGLRHELTAALHKAAANKEIVRTPGLRVKTNGDFTAVNLTVRPVEAGSGTTTPLFLVILEEAPFFDPEQVRRDLIPDAVAGTADFDADADARIAALRQKLQAKEEYLQSTNEELKPPTRNSSRRTRRCSRSTRNCSRPTRNWKPPRRNCNPSMRNWPRSMPSCRPRFADLSRANNDMNNLMAGTGIGTVFVNHGLRILRFTPTATRIINLIAGDVGRPVNHIVSNLVGYDGLAADTKAVLDTLIPNEMEVQTKAGAWYTMRIQPYRTLDNVIEGAVITFVDINERKQVETAVRESECLFRQLTGILPQFVWTCRSDGHCDYLSPRWVEYTGVPEAEQWGRGCSIGFTRTTVARSRPDGTGRRPMGMPTESKSASAIATATTVASRPV